jgi:hypothetical protein
MSRFFQIGSAFLAVSLAAFCDQGGGGKAARPAPASPARPRQSAEPRAAKVMGPRLTNPGNPVTRLYRASPQERERALEKLPPAMQDRFRQNLKWFDSLPKAQQEIVVQRSERFAALPPEKRRQFLLQMRALNQLPVERRRPLVQMLRRLQMMPDADRNSVLNSEEFKTRFSPEEQKMVLDLSEVMLPPM